MEKLLGNKDCWTKSLEKCSKTCFSTEVAAFKSRSWRAANVHCAIMYNVQCPIIRCNVQYRVPLLTFKSRRSLKAAFGLLSHSNANSHSPS